MSQRLTLPCYVDTEELTGIDLGVVAKEAILLKTTSDNVTEYHTPLIALLYKLRKVIFPRDKPWGREASDSTPK